MSPVRAILTLVLLVWSPWTHQLVTPEELDRQGIAEYGAATWTIVRPIVTGEQAIQVIVPSAPENVSIR